jgi:ribosomal protein S17E
MITCNYNQNNNSNLIEFEVEDRINLNVENYDLEMIQKIVASMFKKYKEDISNKNFHNQNSVDEQKETILKFEKVIRCIRYQVLNMKDFYGKFDDNLELLIEISEVSSIRQSLHNLLEEYFKIYKIEKLKVKCGVMENDVATRIRNYFDSPKIEIDFIKEK